jgi:hypothetical protein
MKPIPQYLTKNTAQNVYRYLCAIADQGNYKVSFKPVSQRTLDQNAKLQAMCTDIADQVVLDTVNGGYRLLKDCQFYKQFSHDDWRHILMAGFTKAEIVPGIEPGQAVCLYPSSTDLSLTKGIDFITYIGEFGDSLGVEWTEPEEEKNEG